MKCALRFLFFALAFQVSSQVVAVEDSDKNIVVNSGINTSVVQVVSPKAKLKRDYNELIEIEGRDNSNDSVIIICSLEYIKNACESYVSAHTRPRVCMEVGRSVIFVSKEEIRLRLYNSLVNDSVFYSGYYCTNVGTETIESHMLNSLDMLDLSCLEETSWVYALESLVKSGCVNAVKKMISRFKKYNKESCLHNFDKIRREHFSKRGVNKNDRPIFWLAAIVTRWDADRVPERNYEMIENHMCSLLCPTGMAEVDGMLVSRNEYISAINNWKEKRKKKAQII